jgi:hypothetical protein
MRTTIELPDELMKQARSHAALAGMSLRQFFIQAVEQKLAPQPRKVRRDPPVVESSRKRPIGPITRKQIDEALFG